MPKSVAGIPAKPADGKSPGTVDAASVAGASAP
jgi:hypothetical protein